MNALHLYNLLELGIVVPTVYPQLGVVVGPASLLLLAAGHIICRSIIEQVDSCTAWAGFGQYMLEPLHAGAITMLHMAASHQQHLAQSTAQSLPQHHYIYVQSWPRPGASNEARRYKLNISAAFHYLSLIVLALALAVQMVYFL